MEAKKQKGWQKPGTGKAPIYGEPMPHILTFRATEGQKLAWEAAGKGSWVRPLLDAINAKM